MTNVVPLATRLARLAPAFKVKPEQVSFLSSPGQYYETLLASIEKATRRVSMASLYLGTEDLERRLVEALKVKLEKERLGQFKVHFHMDYLRGTRGETDSSASLLRPLLRSFPSLTVSMYLTPKLHSTWRRSLIPPRWNEIFGLSHFKVCIFDDNVLVTGANFSKNYFENRADRYVLIREHPQLAAYFDELMGLVSNFSHKLLPDDGMHKCATSVPNTPTCKVEESISEFITRHIRMTGDLVISAHDTVVFPSLQMAPHAIRQDEQLLEDLLQWTNTEIPNAQISLSTGYFNLAPLAQHIFSQASNIKSPWKVLTSSPEANGFFDSVGVSRFIPDSYRVIELEFLKKESIRPRLIRDQDGDEAICEYSRPGWTFHAKGLWIDSPEVMATVIGSSNFGHRSFERDLEAQLVFVTGDEALAGKIKEDRDGLYSYSNTVSASQIEASSPPPLPLRVVTNVIRSFL